MKDIMLSILMIIINTLGVVDIWLILKILFGCDIRCKVKNMLIASVVFMLFDIAISTFAPGEIILSAILVYGYIFIITMLLTKSHRLKTLFLTIPAVLVYTQFGELMALIEKITTLDRFHLLYNSNKITIAYVISEPLLFILLILLYRLYRKNVSTVQLTVSEGIFITIFCAFSPIIVSILELLEEYANNSIYNIAWVVFMISLNLAVIYAIFHRKKASYYRKLSENIKEQFNTEYTYFRDYKEKQEATNKFRHDWKNHMLLLQEMLSIGDYNKAQEYFNTLCEKTESTNWHIVTGCEIVDMIVSSKYHILEKYNIVFGFKGNMAYMNNLQAIDCCILFSNLLDNAIEANINCKADRYIQINAREKENTYYIDMSNPIEQDVKCEAGRMVTTKADKELHGIGFNNCIDIIEKYKGEYQIQVTKNQYCIKMIFSK